MSGRIANATPNYHLYVSTETNKLLVSELYRDDLHSVSLKYYLPDHNPRYIRPLLTNRKLREYLMLFYRDED